jgi:hypothetical protein
MPIDSDLEKYIVIGVRPGNPTPIVQFQLGDDGIAELLSLYSALGTSLAAEISKTLNVAPEISAAMIKAAQERGFEGFTNAMRKLGSAIASAKARPVAED